VVVSAREAQGGLGRRGGGVHILLPSFFAFLENDKREILIYNVLILCVLRNLAANILNCMNIAGVSGGMEGAQKYRCVSACSPIHKKAPPRARKVLCCLEGRWFRFEGVLCYVG
jgi:hypothetical protein